MEAQMGLTIYCLVNSKQTMVTSSNIITNVFSCLSPRTAFLLLFVSVIRPFTYTTYRTPFA